MFRKKSHVFRKKSNIRKFDSLIFLGKKKEKLISIRYE